MRFVANTGDQMLVFPLRPGSTIVGRHATCHICLPSKSVSRRHAQVYIDGASVLLRDLGSAHGTCVNGQRVERAELHDGDMVSIGGVQMRFEGAGAPAAAAFGRSASPAQDIVVTAEPAGPAAGPMPSEPAPAFPQDARTAPISPAEPGAAPGYPPEGAPAPTDFPEQPRGDETPVDQAFVPQPYTPPQPSMLPSATLQPQMVIRDGRWYLRDPRTGREVEIAPKDAALAPAAAGAIPAELRRPNVRLLLAAVGAVAFVVLAFALFVFKPHDGGTDRDQKVFPIREYNAILEEAIDLFDKNKVEDALTRLRAARDLDPEERVRTANHIKMYIDLRKAAGQDLDKFSWIDAERYLDGVRNSQTAPDGARAFVNKQQKWIQIERTAIGLREQALAKWRDSGPTTEDALKTAFSELSEIPAGTFAARKSEADRTKIRADLFEHYRGKAKRAEAERKWSQAVDFLKIAMDYTDNPAPLKKLSDSYELYARQAQDLLNARKDVEEKNYAAAEPLLQAIKAPSPYANDAGALLATIAAEKSQKIRKDQVQEIVDLYTKGSGEEAAALAEKYGLPQFAYFKERAKDWKSLMAEAAAAEKAGDYETAQTKYDEAAGIESDDKNYYRRTAKERVQTLKARAPEFAAKIAEAAQKLEETDPAQARAGAERSLRFNPEQELARTTLKNLQARATNLYTQGSSYFDKKQYPAALKCLEVARACADPKTEVYRKTLQLLQKIPKEE